MLRQRLQSSIETGFSLIEIMIGMVIGALGVAIMLQLFAASEGQNRTITAGGDAQINAAIAMNTLRADILISGYGLAYPMLGCDVLLPSGVTIAGMAPVTINPAAIPAGDPNTDTVLVAYGSGNGSSEGDGITSAPPTGFPNNVYAVQTPTSFASGDLVIALPRIPTPPPLCNNGVGLVIDRVTNVLVSNVTVAAGVAGMANGRLYNLGQTVTLRAYAVRGGNLTVCDYGVNDCGLAANVGNEAIWTPIAGGIVSMRAQYARDTLTPAPVTTPEPQIFYRADTYDQTAPACWARVSAVRMALVARSDQLEKPTGSPANHVTSQAPVWAGSATSPIDVSGYPAAAGFSWQDYRYKVLQTVMPLRNVSWIGVQAGC